MQRNTALLQWYLDSGVDETIAETPRNYFTPAPTPLTLPESQPATEPKTSQQPVQAKTTSFLVPAASAAIAEARALADACSTLAQLREAVEKFNGLSIKKTAHNMVFADGNPDSGLMIIGEAPGEQEDLKAIPFCGPSGALLDKMFAAIGRDRSSFYISNTVFWRPPGNRQPSSEELAICAPFVEKHIALVKPKLLVLAGGIASTAVLKREQSIGRLRGKFYDYGNGYMADTIPCCVMFHPSYLLRSPQQKRLAWSDLLMIRQFLNG